MGSIVDVVNSDVSLRGSPATGLLAAKPVTDAGYTLDRKSLGGVDCTGCVSPDHS